MTFFRAGSHPATDINSLNLTATERAGRMLLLWEPCTPVIQNVNRATVEVKSSSSRKTFTIDSSSISQGSLDLPLSVGDSLFTLQFYRNGQAVEHASIQTVGYYGKKSSSTIADAASPGNPPTRKP